MANHPLDELAAEFCRENGFEFAGFGGQGAFKRTYKISDKSGALLALKIVDPETSSVDRTRREIETLQNCKSPRLSNYHSSGELPFMGAKATYLIEEFFTGGTLADKLNERSKLNPDEVIAFGRALTEAIIELKRLDLVHRDIKPDNIMFRGDDPVPVLTDFGLVRDLGKSSLTPSWQPQGPGTPMFSAPEQLNNEKMLIGWRTDQFSLGLVLAFCLTGCHPFRSDGMSDYDAICAVADRKPLSSAFRTAAESQNVRQLLRQLNPWPIGRYPTPQSLLSAFS